MPRECFQREYVRCGKRTCRTCPHGPYWYAYWWEGGRTRKRYVGKKDPRAGGPGEAGGPAQSDAAPPDWREAINDRRTATEEIACRILGIRPPPTRDVVYSAYRRNMATLHPDRGGDPREAGYVAAAFTYLKGLHEW